MTANVHRESRPCLLCAGVAFEPVERSTAQLHATREEFTFVRCLACSLVQLHPRVPLDAVGAYYDDSYLLHRGPSAWGRYAHLVEQAQRATDRGRLRLVQSARPVGPQTRVLDLGCGRPTFLRLLRDETGAHAVGIDFADEAWRDADGRWDGLELHRGTLNSVQLSGKFDTLTLWHALEHDYDPLQTLCHLREVASPGAVLIVEVPNYDSWTRRWQRGHWAGYHTPRHTVAFTPTTLAKMMRKAGWEIVRQARHGTLDPYVLWWLGHCDERRIDLRSELSPHFVRFVFGKLLALPVTSLQRWVSLGVQVTICRRSE